MQGSNWTMRGERQKGQRQRETEWQRDRDRILIPDGEERKTGNKEQRETEMKTGKRRMDTSNWSWMCNGRWGGMVDNIKYVMTEWASVWAVDDVSSVSLPVSADTVRNRVRSVDVELMAFLYKSVPMPIKNNHKCLLENSPFKTPHFEGLGCPSVMSLHLACMISYNPPSSSHMIYMV